MLAQHHARRQSIDGSSELLFQTHTQLFSFSPSTSPVFLELGPFGATRRLIMPGAKAHCPVVGCGERSDRWGKKSYPLPSADIFTLQLASTVDLSVNNRICQRCWERHRDHTMKLDGRIRVHPIPSPSPLDALLSAVSIPLPQRPVPLPSPSFIDSLPSATPTLARVITVFPTHPIVSSSPSTVQSQSNQSPTLITTPRRTHSFPPVLDLSPAPSTYSERQRDVVASVMAGIDYERYRLQQVMQGVTPMAKSTWYDHQSTVYNSIIQIAEIKEVEYLQMLRATGQRVVLWSHLSYEANQCCWLLVLAQNKQIVLAVILTMHHVDTRFRL